MTQSPPALLVAGPTASGKSALALALAARFGGTVINADSMQLYAELPILTAQPSAAERAGLPHRLYGVRPAATAASVAWWREAALAALAEAWAAGRLPILCGGTGLYFRALTEGLAAIPPVPPEARAEARQLLAEEGAAALHARLAALDPATAAGLRPGDSQRVARAYEVVRGTGQGLHAWQQAGPALPPAPCRFAAILLAGGALAEARALAGLGLDPALPAMRAHGVPELLAHLAGRLSLAAAEAQAVLHTRQYTKRQATWFRHHRLAPSQQTHIIHARIEGQAQFQESRIGEIFAFVENWR